MSEYYTAPADVTAGNRTRSAKLNEMIQATEDGFDALPATLDTRLDDLDSAVAALAAGSGVVVSSDDTTAGYLTNKLITNGNFGITKTENNPGGNETLGIDIEETLKRTFSL